MKADKRVVENYFPLEAFCYDSGEAVTCSSLLGENKLPQDHLRSSLFPVCSLETFAKVRGLDTFREDHFSGKSTV